MTNKTGEKRTARRTFRRIAGLLVVSAALTMGTAYTGCDRTAVEERLIVQTAGVARTEAEKRESAVQKAAEEERPKIPAANPRTDFRYDLNETSDGIVIQKFIGNGTVVNIPAEIEGYPVKEIGYSAFRDRNVTRVTIPDGVTYIGTWAFCDCTALTTVTIPDGVTYIQSRAFLDCSSLTTVTIPNSVTRIGIGAFGGCTTLSTINITPHPISFDPGMYGIPPAFGGCSRLSLAERRKIQDCGYTRSF